MTDADLARWEAAQGLYAASPLDFETRDEMDALLGEAVPALIAEVRSLRCQLHLLHGMTNEHGRALFPAEETLTP